MDLSRVLDLDFKPITLPRARPRDQRAGRPDPAPAHRRRGGGRDARRAARRAPRAGDGGDQELLRPHRLHASGCARRADVRPAPDRRAHRLRRRPAGRAVQGHQVDAGHRLDRAAAPRARPLPRDHRPEHQLLRDDLRDARRRSSPSAWSTTAPASSSPSTRASLPACACWASRGPRCRACCSPSLRCSPWLPFPWAGSSATASAGF